MQDLKNKGIVTSSRSRDGADSTSWQVLVRLSGPGNTTSWMDGLSTMSLLSINCQSRHSRPQRQPADILHLPLGQIHEPDELVGHDPNSTADVADGLELAEHILGKRLNRAVSAARGWWVCSSPQANSLAFS